MGLLGTVYSEGLPLAGRASIKILEISENFFIIVYEKIWGRGLATWAFSCLSEQVRVSVAGAGHRKIFSILRGFGCWRLANCQKILESRVLAAGKNAEIGLSL
jgi:hypothetical protein